MDGLKIVGILGNRNKIADAKVQLSGLDMLIEHMTMHESRVIDWAC